MSMTGEPWAAPPDGAIDAVDLTVVDLVQDYYAATDPVPHGLLERIDFALELLDVDDEVARLQDDRYDTAGVRSAEHSRTVTFDSESLTIVIQASPIGSVVRVDGWLAPPAARPIRLRAQECELRTESDELGRFVLSGVPHGLVQLIVDVREEEPSEVQSVVTMAVML
jgi:hypothetical protein